MTIALVTLLLVLCVVVIAYPFFSLRAGARSFAPPGEDIADQIRRARDRVYEEIRALQQEYFLENLTDAEYRAQLEGARRRAADLIRKQQQVQETMRSVEEAVEEELARVWAPLEQPRDAPAADGDAAGERQG